MIEPLQTVSGRTYPLVKPPADDLDHVFLGNAIRLVGAGLFGTEWDPDQRDRRWTETIENLRAASRSGELISFYRSSGFNLLGTDKWYLDDPASVFRSGKMAPFKGAGDTSEYWVFLGRQSLEAYISKTSGAPVREDSSEGETVEPDPTRFDVLQEPIWTTPMVAAWIATRDVARVRWQWDPYRSAAGKGPATLGLMWVRSAHPMFFESTAAMEELKRQLKAGSIVATAISSKTLAPEQMSRADWTYAKREFDNNNSERWLVENVTFTQITFHAADVLALWPAPGNDADRQTSGGDVALPMGGEAASQSGERGKPKLGRPVGSTSWPVHEFEDELLARLRKHGMPKRVNAHWRSRNAMYDEMLIWCGAEWDDEPGLTTVKEWSVPVLQRFTAELAEKAKKAEK